jgi:hypothetical protein
MITIRALGMPHRCPTDLSYRRGILAVRKPLEILWKIGARYGPGCTSFPSILGSGR